MSLLVRKTTATLPPRILIHGQEGVGKTSLAAKFPAPVFILTEDGCPAGLEIDSFDVAGTYAEVREQLSALATEDHDFQTVVIDSLDPLEAMIWKQTCVENGWATLETPGFGKGYVTADAHWHDLIAAFDYLRRDRRMIVVLLAHSAIETVNDPRAPSYTSYQLRLHKRARGFIQDAMDAIGFMAPDLVIQQEDIGFNKKRARGDGGFNRFLHFEARPSFVAKNRYGLPAKMLVGRDFDYAKSLESHFPTAPAEDRPAPTAPAGSRQSTKQTNERRK